MSGKRTSSSLTLPSNTDFSRKFLIKFNNYINFCNNILSRFQEIKMKKISLFFCCFAAMFLMLSCGGDSKNNDRNQGELYGECYPNETCNEGLVCDTEYNICIKDRYDDYDEKPAPDDSDDSMPDDNIIPAGPCDANPCSDIENSDGMCFETGETTFSCGCETGYFWNNSQCKKSLSIGNICTNQKKCYNNDLKSIACPASSSEDFYGQDAQYSEKCTPQDFTLGIKALEGTITDNNTGLVWQQSSSAHSYNWDDANNADNENAPCVMLNNENYANMSNWRVPNALELMTIVDSSECKFATNPNFDFTGLPTVLSGFLWTSDEFGTDTSQARAFDPQTGFFFSGKAKSLKYYVLCVAGDELAPTASTDFVISSDGMTVTDKRTGLIWQKEYGSDKTWQEALKYCEDSVYAGYSDWRLPNKNELLSLLDPGKSSAPYSNFPNMENLWFWSSSTDVCDAYYAWFVLFNIGNVSSYLKTNQYSVRCVRSE